MSRKMWALDQKYSKRTKLLRGNKKNGRVRSILLASASLPRSLRERRDIIKGCVLLLWPRLREGMLRK
jgi:hypothetical protein